MRFKHTAVMLGFAFLPITMTSPARAQSDAYPTQPVRIIVPFGAGGGVDVLARLLSSHLSELLKQIVLVENRPGGASIIGAQAVAVSKPDGYTLLLNSSAQAITPFMYAKLPFDPYTSFTAITEVGRNPFVLCVHPGVPGADLKGLVEYAKANPEKLSFGVAGIGTPDHISLELLSKRAEAKMLIVNFKGGGPALSAALGGQIGGVMLPAFQVAAHATAGRLKCLGVTSPTKLDQMPSTPPISAVFPGYQFFGWYGLWGPKGMDPKLTKRIQESVTKVLTTAAFRARAETMGVEPSGTTPQEFTEYLKGEMATYDRLINERGIKAE